MSGLKRKRRRECGEDCSYIKCLLPEGPQDDRLSHEIGFESSQQIVKLKPENTLDKPLSDDC